MMMKKLGCIALALLGLTALSCKNGKEGGWEPIQLDKYEVLFSASGGESVISASNYPEILISSLENVETGDQGYRTESGKTASLTGIELEAAGNQLKIHVSAAEESHSWRIVLWHLDAVSQPVYVYQNRFR